MIETQELLSIRNYPDELRIWQSMGVGGIRAELLVELGRPMDVLAIGGMEGQACFKNSIIRAFCDRDTAYVEGATLVADAVWITHAWNRDENSQFVDHTLKGADRGPYYGLVIPRDVAFEVQRSRKWGIGDGVLGTLQFLSKKTQDRLVRKIRRANIKDTK
jgi:hypothetical protein